MSENARERFERLLPGPPSYDAQLLAAAADMVREETERLRETVEEIRLIAIGAPYSLAIHGILDKARAALEVSGE